MSPEILRRSGHSFAVDWWTLGVLVYEMVIGIRPFATTSRDVNKKYNKIMYDDIIFPTERHSV